MPTCLTDRFSDALELAREFHANGDAEDGVPHSAHLLQVAGMVLEAGGDEDQAIAALFHDALETAGSADQAESRESSIRDEFGDHVVELVVACADGAAKGGFERSWKEEKEAYIHHLWTGADDGAVRVSAADRLCTARRLLNDYRTYGEGAWARYDGGRSGTLWYYRALVGAYRYRRVNGHADELDHIVSTLEQETAVA